MDRHAGSPWVYPSETLATSLDLRNFYARIFHPALVKANLNGLVWHTFRYMFASRLAMSEQTEAPSPPCSDTARMPWCGDTLTWLPRTYRPR